MENSNWTLISRKDPETRPGGGSTFAESSFRSLRNADLVSKGMFWCAMERTMVPIRDMVRSSMARIERDTSRSS